MGHHSLIEKKITSLQQLSELMKKYKTESRKVVFTNGCFDILHKGHIDYLSRAADLGDILIVAVNSDASVKKLGKDPSRPIQDENSRMSIIAALESVSHVILFSEDTPAQLIDTLIPDVLVKGADYKAEDIVGYHTVTQNGGKVMTLSFIEGHSTTTIVNKIKNS